MSTESHPPLPPLNEEPGTPIPGRHQDRVAIITGASRGIGKAVARRLALEGATIIVAAKSAGDPAEKLPGTIHETVSIIEEAGGTARPFKIDVRDEAQIELLVNRTIDEFGRIDYLFNNAGAIHLRSVIDTPPKRYDLMLDINVRASHTLAHFVLPHMVKQQFGHVLMFSPELHTQPSPGMAAYMVSKLGMTRVAISIAEEHRADNIAGNAIWPVTMIDTLAVRNNGLSDVSQCRTPEIICDAVSELLSRPPAECTGNQYTDEDVLREAGVTDFDHYWVNGAPPETPMLIAGAGSVIR